jgi:ABC-type antimicrobial peptide transport system permease subunit
MNWRNLVTKNMLRNLRRYLGYLLAALLAVTVFTMFTAFVDNPAVQQGHFSSSASEMLIVFRVIVALFAIFFVFYFHAALVRARNKEFGLLLTLGVTPRQIGRLIFYESLLIGLLALVAGIGLGIICSYFFLLAMGAILALPSALPFAVPPTTFITTGIFFGAVFLLEATWISLRVTRRTPRVLLLGARTQQKPPRANWLIALFGLLCIGAAYDMALQFSMAIIMTMIPIIGLTIFGTYLLFSQCSVMLLQRLRRPGIPGTRLLIVARLSHRMRDYARMLTVVTVLNAVVLTGMGAVFGVMQVIQAEQTSSQPFALQLAVNAVTPTALTPEQIRQEIQREHFTLQTSITTPLLTGVAASQGLSQPVSILSLSNFKRLQQAEFQAHPDLANAQPAAGPLASNDQIYLYIPDTRLKQTFSHLQLTIGKMNLTLRVADQGSAGVINDWHDMGNDRPSIVNVVTTDALYAQLSNSAEPAAHWQMYSYVLPDWQHSAHLASTMRQQLPEQQRVLLTDTATALTEVEQYLSVMLFADFFVSCLFFLAAGSAIYFKLFNQQEEDQRQFHALERIGMQRREAARLLSWEFLLLFFIPVTLAIVHSVVALLDLANLTNDPQAVVGIGKAFALICLAYLACFAIYFWITRVNYLRRMRLVAV